MSTVADSWFASLILTDKKTPKPCLTNAILLVTNERELAGRFRFNAFTYSIELRDGETWRPLQDNDVTRATAALDQYVVLSTEMVFKAIAAVAERNTVHPVRDYLTNLKWDGSKRLELLFGDYFITEEDKPLYREIGRRFMIGAVARVFEPGCKHDTYPVLEGQQGTLKSSTLRALLPKAEWFSDTKFDINSKDAYLAMQGVWLYEVAELETFKGASATHLKSFISSSTDKFRPPYGRLTVAVARQVVFVATTNEKDYVQDRTGERRMQPIALTSVNLEAVKRDRDQLWAEAYLEYRAGERWHLEGEAAKAIKEEAMARHDEDPWVELLQNAIVQSLGQALQRVPNCPEDLGFITRADAVAAVSEHGYRGSKSDGTRLTAALRSLGLRSGDKRSVEGKTRNTWAVTPALLEAAQKWVGDVKLKNQDRATGPQTAHGGRPKDPSA